MTSAIAGSVGEQSAVRVTAGSRLHFGLIAIQATAERAFGGLGITLERPAVRVEIRSAERWVFQGPRAARAARVVGRLLRHPATAMFLQGRRFSVRILAAPPQHAGLGLGTQLSLAVATGLLVAASASPPPDLPQILGRGRRSHVGIQAFRQGGFILDRGRGTPGKRTISIRYPRRWPWVIAVPETDARVSGDREERLMAAAASLAPDLTQPMWQLAKAAARAVRQRDFTALVRSLEAYGTLAGIMFQPLQGGLFRWAPGHHLAALVRHRFQLPVLQSSWGPSLAIPTPDVEVATAVRREIEQTFRVRTAVTPARNVGAAVEASHPCAS